MRRSYFILACLMMVVSDANAQDNYVPPPLFGIPTKAKPELIQPQKATTIVQPKSQPAPRIIEPALVKQKQTVKPKAAQNKMAVSKPPKPALKKAVIKNPDPSLKFVIVTDIKAPEDYPASIALPEKMSSAGVVRGPKSMPAVKKQAVDTEVLFAPTDNKQIGLIDRAQTKGIKSKGLEVDQIASIDPKALPNITLSQDGGQKISLIFTPSTTTLDNKIQAILKKVVSEYIKNDGKKIQVLSFASDVSGELSADRRVALSRALAIRSYLTARGIESRYIEVRALGSVESDLPQDRTELTIIK